MASCTAATKHPPTSKRISLNSNNNCVIFAAGSHKSAGLGGRIKRLHDCQQRSSKQAPTAKNILTPTKVARLIFTTRLAHLFPGSRARLVAQQADCVRRAHGAVRRTRRPGAEPHKAPLPAPRAGGRRAIGVHAALRGPRRFGARFLRPARGSFSVEGKLVRVAGPPALWSSHHVHSKLRGHARETPPRK